MSRTDSETIRRRIALLARRGEGHWAFALHAAFPLSLTPRLAYLLWANFQAYASHGAQHRIPWVAVSDLLLSPVCREIQPELYELDPAIRRELLFELEADERFGKKRIEELSSFLLTYVKKELTGEDQHTKHQAQLQSWMALAYVKPNQLARELAERFRTLQAEERMGTIRHAAITEVFSESLKDFQPLLGYSKYRAHHARGNTDEAIRILDEYEIGDSLNIAGLELPLWHTRPKTFPQPVPDQISKAIQEAKKSHRLDLTKLNLTELPDEIWELEDLEILELSENQLTSIPENIGQLSRLKRLNLEKNQLKNLPESLGQLTVLETLDLRKNPKLGIPDELLEKREGAVISSSTKLLKGLRNRFFFSEQKDAAPQRVLTTPKEILDYYFRIRERARPLNEAKLILVGRGRVGKTSLVKRLKANQFNPEEEETAGIEIENWQIPVCFEESGNTTEKVHLHLWDFGGQEFFHATHRFFLTGRSLYLLVLNGREGGAESEALYWLELIQSAGENSRVLIVLNRNAEHPFDVDRESLREKFPIIRGFIKTDCKTGLGIVELKQAIARETALLEGVHKAFPASWYKLKDRVSGMSEAFLEFVKFRQLCSEFEIPESDHDLLADVLNALGIALNFRRDAYLQSTQVLNPRWVTGGVYAILYSKMVRDAGGVVSLRDLDEILDKTNYPKRMHGFLMRLMESFELCFQLSKNQFLFPDLLDQNRPEGVDEFKPEECLNFEYHYSILPEGIIPRFIVRTNEMSDRQPRWRTGVVCANNDCRALVRADIQARKTVIRIQGKEGKRRYLLGIIRSHFDVIHQAVKLKVDEMVPLPSHPNFAVSYEKLLRIFDDGIEAFPEWVDGKTITVDVKQLLEGVGRIVSDELRLKIIRVINGLLDEQFQILLAILPNDPKRWFAGRQTGPAEHAADLVKWADGPYGCGLEELARHLDEILGSRNWRDSLRPEF